MEYGACIIIIRILLKQTIVISFPLASLLLLPPPLPPSFRHTGIVVYGLEYFYGGLGIEYCSPVSQLPGEGRWCEGVHPICVCH